MKLQTLYMIGISTLVGVIIGYHVGILQFTNNCYTKGEFKKADLRIMCTVQEETLKGTKL